LFCFNNKYKILIVFLTLGLSLSGQRTGLDLLGSKHRIEIPFNQSNGLLLIELKMNGIPLTFMYDTGAENTILFKKEIAVFLGLESDRRIRIIGSDLSDAIYGFIVHNVNFKIRSEVQRVESIIVLEDNVYKIQESTGHQIDGLLGGNFFRNTIVKIDYRRSKIIVQHPVKAKLNLVGYEEVSSVFYEQKPYLKAKLKNFEGNQRDIILLIDTGSSIPFILHTNVDSNLQVPKHLIRGNLGIGLSGTLIGLIGIISRLDLDGFRFNELLTHFQELDETVLEQKDIIRHGILGNDILKRFTIIVDYFQRKVYFKPSKNYNKAFEYDKSGLIFIASGLDFNEYFVRALVPDSPAKKAGLQKGDKLLSLQRIPASFRSLGNIQKFLKRKTGTRVRMKVLRGDEKIVFRFTLYDMLKENLTELIQNSDTGTVLQYSEASN
jgi:hypothetical protein